MESVRAFSEIAGETVEALVGRGLVAVSPGSCARCIEMESTLVKYVHLSFARGGRPQGLEAKVEARTDFFLQITGNLLLVLCVHLLTERMHEGRTGSRDHH